MLNQDNTVHTKVKLVHGTETSKVNENQKHMQLKQSTQAERKFKTFLLFHRYRQCVTLHMKQEHCRWTKKGRYTEAVQQEFKNLTSYTVRVEVLVAVLLTIQAIWDFTPC
jgi:hypothetical protein